MITLITGTPGAGKTLYALNYVKDLSERENRPVFYNGVNDLKLPWSELDRGEDWHTCPAGAIVLIDECQRVFRPRGNGSAVPPHVEKLETHRHGGVDLVVITQHPMLIESNVRRLVGRHFHVMRNFGMKRATVHEWSSTKENCDKSRSDSIKHQFGYPARSFEWYKSAELHTHKARIPAKLWVFLTLPLVLGGIAWAMYQWQMNKVQGVKAESVLSGKAAGVAPVTVAAAAPAVDPMQWFKDQTPRIVGLPHTAPVYDDLAKPVVLPLPAGCIAGENSCNCYTAQGTKIAEMQDAVCQDIVKNGFFNPYKIERNEKRDERGGAADTAGASPVTRI